MCIVRNLMDRKEATRLPIKDFALRNKFNQVLRHKNALNSSYETYKWVGQRKATQPDDLFVALTGYPLISCTSAELTSVSPDTKQHTDQTLFVKRQRIGPSGRLDVLHAGCGGHDVRSAIGCYRFPSNRPPHHARVQRP